jgi:hypothetical protein
MLHRKKENQYYALSKIIISVLPDPSLPFQTFPQAIGDVSLPSKIFPCLYEFQQPSSNKQLLHSDRSDDY